MSYFREMNSITLKIELGSSHKINLLGCGDQQLDRDLFITCCFTT